MDGAKGKGRAGGCECADGSKHREKINKEVTAPAKVATESVFVTMSVGAHEGQDLAMFDIPGAYIHSEADEDVIMLPEVPLAKLMVKVEPNIY